MIRYLILLLLTLFIMAYAKPAFAGEIAIDCTSSPIYDNNACYSYSNPPYEYVIAKAGIYKGQNQFRDCTVNSIASKCVVGRLRMNYYCDGGGGNITTPTTATIKAYAKDSTFSCSETSCSSSATLISSDSTIYNSITISGETTIFTAPKQLSYLAFQCLFNPEKDVTDSWRYGGVNYNLSNKYVVGCINDSDCSGGQVCNNTGSWDTWQCTNPPFTFSLSPATTTKSVLPGETVSNTITVTNTTLGSIPKSVTLNAFAYPDWTQATANAAWSARYGHTSVVFDDGTGDKMYVIGGSSGASDVWKSSDGVDWTQATANAGWGTRSSHTSLVYNGRMWVIGGFYAGYGKNDVWWSTDGVSWTRATEHAPWDPRWSHTSLVYNGRMWVIGGEAYPTTGGSTKNDVWWSTDGVSWTRATEHAPWSARNGHASVVFDDGTGDKMYVIGGYTNDVWKSSDGVDWTQATANAGWPQHINAAPAVFDNKMWILGGVGGAYYNDAWYSINGVNWTQAINNAAWSGRSRATSLIFNNKMWIIGGYYGIGYKNDVWFYQPPTTTIPTPSLSPQNCTPTNSYPYQCTSTVSVNVPTGISQSSVTVTGSDGTNTQTSAFGILVPIPGSTNISFGIDNPSPRVGDTVNFGGILKDNSGTPIPGQVISLINTDNDTVLKSSNQTDDGITHNTDSNGHYVIGLPINSATQFSVYAKYNGDTTFGFEPSRSTNNIDVFPIPPCSGEINLTLTPTATTTTSQLISALTSNVTNCGNENVVFTCVTNSPGALCPASLPRTCTINLTSPTGCAITFNSPTQPGSYTIFASIMRSPPSSASKTLLVTNMALASGTCGEGTARATGLVSTPAKNSSSNFGTSGGCIIDPKAEFVRYKIPTFDDLKSLYYTQK